MRKRGEIGSGKGERPKPISQRGMRREWYDEPRPLNRFMPRWEVGEVGLRANTLELT